MNVWIINPYGNLPGEGWREYRSTLIARALEKAGHDSVWWVSNFEHRTKSFRCDTWRDVHGSPHSLIRIVPSSPYYSHISFARIRYETLFARNLYERALACLPPDVIVLTEPALFFSAPVVALVRRWKVKLVVDILDLWPELFHLTLPRVLAWTGRLLFLPLYRRRAALFRSADAIVAAAKDYARVARRIAPITRTELVYLGIDNQAVRTAMCQQHPPTGSLGINDKPAGEVWAIYAGTLGDNYDIRTLLKACAWLEQQRAPVRILIAGEGPLKGLVKSSIASHGLANTTYLGNMAVDGLSRLYKHCDIALSTYRRGSTVAMPVKAFDYLAAGLPLVNSLGKDLGDFVTANNVGLQYRSEDWTSLAAAIMELAGNPTQRKTMAANATALADALDCEKQYDRYVRLLEEVVSGARTKASGIDVDGLPRVS